MPKRLIFTVGTNPLPVRAAYEVLKTDGAKVTLVHGSDQAVTQAAERLKRQLERAGASIELLPVDEGNPNRVVEALRAHLGARKGEDVHVHYTGGTKAMAVHVWEAAYGHDGPKTKTCSYLDPRGSRGHEVRDGSGRVLCPDAREKLQISIEDLAALHGYELADANPAPRTEAASQLMAALAHPGAWKEYETWRKCQWFGALTGVDAKPSGKADHPAYRKLVEGAKAMPAKIAGWPAITDAVNVDFCGGVTVFKQGVFEVPAGKTPPTEEQFGQLNKFFFQDWLELAAFRAFKGALEAVRAKNSCRNFSVYHSGWFHPVAGGKCFELDVLAALGYHVILVSCGATSREPELKLKGFEALFRARQVGGEEARTILLCAADEASASRIEEDIHLHIGGRVKPIEVWGRDSYGNLANRFAAYLESLQWS